MLEAEDRARSVSGRFARYLLVAGIAALVNLLARIPYDALWGFERSIPPAYVTGLFVNYALSRRLVFERDDSVPTIREFTKFCLIAAIGLGVVWLSSLAVYWWSETALPDLPAATAKTAAHAIGIGTGFLANFVGHSLFSFRSSGVWRRVTGSS